MAVFKYFSKAMAAVDNIQKAVKNLADLGNSEINDANIGLLIIDIDGYGQEILENLHISVISGEYNISAQDGNIYKISESIETSIAKFQETDEHIKIILNGSVAFRDFLKIYSLEVNFKAILELYHDFINFVHRKLQIVTHNKSYEFEFYALHTFDLRETTDLKTKIEEAAFSDYKWPFLVEIFKVNVALAELDLKFQCTEEFLRILIHIRSIFSENIRRGNLAVFGEILYNKCSFMIAKIMHRLGYKSIFINIPHDLQALERDDLKSEIGCFQCYYNLTAERYENTSTYSVDSSTYNQVKECVFGNSSLIKYSDLHFLSKYYYKTVDKKNIDNFANNENLINIILPKIRKPSEHGQFNIWSNDSTLLLLKKNSLKIKSIEIENDLKSDNLTFDKIQDGYEKVQELYNDINYLHLSIDIQDYYQHLLYIKAIKLLVTHSLKKIEEEIFIANISFWLQLLDDSVIAFDKCYNGFDWVYKHHYLPIYMPYDECQMENVKLMDSELPFPIFMDSSYILPINVDKDKEVIRKLKVEIDTLKANVLTKFTNYIKQVVSRENQGTFNQLSTLFDAKKEELIKKFDDKVKDSQTSAIQIIGFYAGFVTFILSTASKLMTTNGKFIDYAGFYLLFLLGSLFFVISIAAMFSNEPTRSLRIWLFDAENNRYLNKFALSFYMLLISILTIVFVAFISNFNFTPMKLIFLLRFSYF